MAEQKRYSQYEEAWNQSEKRVNTELQLARGFQVADVYLNRTYLESFSAAPIVPGTRALMDTTKLRLLEITKIVYANCAEQWNIEKKDGRIDWDAADVRDWRRENNCSWHECCDTRTMMLVPTEIHGYFRHSGGVAECKARDNADVGGGFDE